MRRPLLSSLATSFVLAVAGLAPTVLVEAPGHAVAVQASHDPDSDGDGLADSVDGCPAVAAPTSTGCPTAARAARLRWLDGQERLQATISSPVTACAAGARIKLWRVRPGRDTRLTAVDASAAGRHRFRVARGARYYVTVSSSYRPGQAECGAAESRTVRVPRR